MSGEKVEPPHCDGTNHRWTFTKPVHCAGCMTMFTDAEALEREIALRKRGLVERKFA